MESVPGVTEPVHVFPAPPAALQCACCASGVDPWATYGYCRRCGDGRLSVCLHPRSTTLTRNAPRVCVPCLSLTATAAVGKSARGCLVELSAEHAPVGTWRAHLCLHHLDQALQVGRRALLEAGP